MKRNAVNCRDALKHGRKDGRYFMGIHLLFGPLFTLYPYELDAPLSFSSSILSFSYGATFCHFCAWTYFLQLCKCADTLKGQSHEISVIRFFHISAPSGPIIEMLV